jgi:hypothetical protein
MSTVRILKLLAMVAFAVAFVGCSTEQIENLPDQIPGLGDSNLHVHYVRSIKTVPVHRVAVMPLINYPDVTEPGSIEEGAAQSLTAQIYSQMQLAGGWQVVPEEDVVAAMQKLPPTTRANLQENAFALAREVSADAVLYGTVHKYQDRVGSSYAASQPASVAFTLMFASLTVKQELWRAQFAKTQESLSQNAFNIVSFFQNQARWVRAVDLATEGVDDAIRNLHAHLNLTPNVKYFAIPNELNPGPR